MEIHPLAETMPFMSDEEFSSLKASIATDGVIHPVLKFEGKVLDGRGRLRACDELGVPCVNFKTFEGTYAQAAKVVEALRLGRSHMTPEQQREARARIARELRSDGMSTRAIADALGVSPKTVRDDLGRQVGSGYPPDPTPPGGDHEPTKTDSYYRGDNPRRGIGAGEEIGGGNHGDAQPASTDPPRLPTIPPPTPSRDHRGEVNPSPATVTGRDGKKYAATKPQKPKPASKPAAPKSSPPAEPVWAEFLAKLAAVSEFSTSITTSPESMQSWQLVNSLESAARSLLAAAAKLRTNPR